MSVAWVSAAHGGLEGMGPRDPARAWAPSSEPLVKIMTKLHLLLHEVAQSVKKSPAVQETWVQTPGRKDLLEKGMATHSSVLAWRIPWTEEPGRLQSMGSQRVGHD